MKIKYIILCIILLVIADQAIKLVIDRYWLDTHFDIIPSLFEFRPVFNDKYSYVNHLLSQKFNIDMGFWMHILIFAFAEYIILTLYFSLKRIMGKTRLLDIAISFQIASLISALISNIFWEKGVLDYIYLKPLFIFDLKDLYTNLFTVLLCIYLFKNKEKLKTVTFKDLFFHKRNK